MALAGACAHRTASSEATGHDHRASARDTHPRSGPGVGRRGVDGSALVLISHTHPLPIYRDVDFSWAFVLENAAGAHTRLIMRARISYTPVGPRPIIRSLVAAGFGIGDVVQAGAMLGGIKARAEAGRATQN